MGRIMNRIASLFFSAVLLQCTACAVSERVTYADQEGKISEKTLQKISRQGASQHVVVGNLGLPSSIDKIVLQDQQSLYEIYNYRLTETQVRSGHLFYLLKAAGSEQNQRYFHVAFREGVVDSTWINSDPRAEMTVHVTNAQASPDTVQATKEASRSSAEIPTQAPVKTVDIETKTGKVTIVTEKTEDFKWKLPFLNKWLNSNKAPATAATTPVPASTEPDRTNATPLVEPPTAHVRPGFETSEAPLADEPVITTTVESDSAPADEEAEPVFP